MPTLPSLNPSLQSMKRLFFKPPNPTTLSHSSHNRHLRVADILLADDEYDAADHLMDSDHQSPPRAIKSKCYSPRRFVDWLLAALRPTKDRSIVKRPQKLPPSLPILNELKVNEEESRQLDWNDTSFKLGVGCGLLYVIAATKNELSKMVELRKEMEIILQNMKGELQSKDAILKSLKQCDDALACSIDIQEVSCSNSHLSSFSQNQCVQSELKSKTVSNRFIDYNVSETDERTQEISELQAEFEYELQRLEIYLDGEDAFEDAQQERIEVADNDTSTKSQGSSFGEIIIEPQGASYDTSFGVSPVELERKLHELLESRLQERITELESALEYATQKLDEKEIKVTLWEDTARIISHHVPETSRFTFPLDPDAFLKFSQVVG